MATITCPKCGTKNPDDRMNCQKCGINLQWALENPAEIERLKAESEHGEMEARYIVKEKARKVEIIVGIVLLIGAFLCSLIAFTEKSISLEREPGAAAEIAVIVAVLLAIGIPLILGPSKTSVMYFVNAVFLGVMTLLIHPWSLSGTYTSVLTLLDLSVILPCLGAVLFGTLCARKTQLKGLRITSWILAGIGGLGAILFVVELAKIFAPWHLDHPGYVAMGAAILAGLLAGAIPLILGPSKTSVMYFVNAVFLAVMTLFVHTRILTQVLDTYAMMLSLGLEIRWLTLPNLYIVLPSLGAIAFGTLCARKTQIKGLRITSWICVSIGGLGTILFVAFAAGLVKFFM